jgi:MFS family permease
VRLCGRQVRPPPADLLVHCFLSIMASSREAVLLKQQDGAREPLAGNFALLSAHMFLRVTVGCCNMATEPMHAVAMCGGDVTAAMALLASSSGLTGLLQFVLNPTFGTLSDRFGRRPFFFVGPAWNCVGNLLIALNPRRRALFFVLRAVGKTLQTLSGSTITMAALSDCATGEQLTAWSAWLGSAACAGVIVGGLLETTILLCTPTSGSAAAASRAVYLFMSALGLGHTLLLALFLRETLPPSQRSTAPLTFQTPFDMLQLFCRGRTLRLASLSCGFACFADGSNLNDIDQMWIKQDVHDMGTLANSVCPVCQVDKSDAISHCNGDLCSRHFALRCTSVHHVLCTTAYFAQLWS